MLDRKKQMARAALDQRSAGFGSLDQYQRPSGGWIKAIREALGMSAVQLGDRMGLTRQRIHEIEKAELHGNVTLNSLRKAAEELECSLIYTLVPNAPLEKIVGDRARNIARQDLAHLNQTMALEDQAVPGTGQEDQIREYIEMHLSEKDLWVKP